MRTDASQPASNGVKANRDAPSTTLRGRWLLAARAGWLAVATLTLGLMTAGVVVAFDRPDLIRQPSARAIFADAGVPDQVTNVLFLITVAAFAAPGLLIFWRRSDDWAAMLFALMLVTGGIILIRQEWALEQAVPSLELPVRFVWLLAMFLWLVVLFVFPDGRFVPRWTRLLAAAAIPAAALLVDFPKLWHDVSQGGSKTGFGLAVLVWSVFWAAGLYGQAHRYRHVSGPVQRQQTKWVALTLGLLFLVVLVGILIPSLFAAPDAWLLWALLVELAVVVLFPASVAVAILRYRLYDIDRLLSRTLTYGLVTLVLGLVYAAAVVLLGQALNARGGDSPLAVAASTLLVAALFQPLRGHIQDRVDRRFNRRRHDAAKTIEAFSARLREQLDLDTLSAELLGVVDKTMQPTQTSVWLRPPTSAPQDIGEPEAQRPAARPTGPSRSGRRGP